MARYFAPLSVLLAFLGFAASQALAQDSVRLEQKFTANELLRYRFTLDGSWGIRMGSSAAGQTQLSPLKVSGVARLRTMKVYPDGSALIYAALESLKTTDSEDTYVISTAGMPFVKMILSGDGSLKSIQSSSKASSPGSVQLLSALSLMFPCFQSTAVKAGETVTCDIPAPADGAGAQSTGGVHAVYRIDTIGQRSGGYRTAKFDENAAAQIAFVGVLPLWGMNRRPDPPNMDVKLTVSKKGATAWGVDLGRAVRSDFAFTGQGTMTMQMPPPDQSMQGQQGGLQQAAPQGQNQGQQQSGAARQRRRGNLQVELKGTGFLQLISVAR